MTVAREWEWQEIHQPYGCADHDQDLIYELSKRLATLSRCDQRIANADGHPKLVDFWNYVRLQEQDNVNRLKELIAEEINWGCF